LSVSHNKFVSFVDGSQSQRYTFHGWALASDFVAVATILM